MGEPLHEIKLRSFQRPHFHGIYRHFLVELINSFECEPISQEQLERVRGEMEANKKRIGNDALWKIRMPLSVWKRFRLLKETYAPKGTTNPEFVEMMIVRRARVGNQGTGPTQVAGTAKRSTRTRMDRREARGSRGSGMAESTANGSSSLSIAMDSLSCSSPLESISSPLSQSSGGTTATETSGRQCPLQAIEKHSHSKNNSQNQVLANFLSQRKPISKENGCPIITRSFLTLCAENDDNPLEPEQYFGTGSSARGSVSETGRKELAATSERQDLSESLLLPVSRRISSINSLLNHF